MAQNDYKIFLFQINGAHAAILTAVGEKSFIQAMAALRIGGRVVALGIPDRAVEVPVLSLVMRGIQIVGSAVGNRKDLQVRIGVGRAGKDWAKFHTL